MVLVGVILQLNSYISRREGCNSYVLVRKLCIELNSLIHLVETELVCDYIFRKRENLATKQIFAGSIYTFTSHIIKLSSFTIFKMLLRYDEY